MAFLKKLKKIMQEGKYQVVKWKASLEISLNLSLSFYQVVKKCLPCFFASSRRKQSYGFKIEKKKLTKSIFLKKSQNIEKRFNTKYIDWKMSEYF